MLLFCNAPLSCTQGSRFCCGWGTLAASVAAARAPRGSISAAMSRSSRSLPWPKVEAAAVTSCIVACTLRLPCSHAYIPALYRKSQPPALHPSSQGTGTGTGRYVAVYSDKYAHVGRQGCQGTPCTRSGVQHMCGQHLGSAQGCFWLCSSDRHDHAICCQAQLSESFTGPSTLSADSQNSNPLAISITGLRTPSIHQRYRQHLGSAQGYFWLCSWVGCRPGSTGGACWPGPAWRRSGDWTPILCPSRTLSPHCPLSRSGPALCTDLESQITDALQGWRCA